MLRTARPGGFALRSAARTLRRRCMRGSTHRRPSTKRRGGSPHLRRLHAPHLLLLTRTLDHLLPLRRRGALPTLTQHLPFLRRQLLEPAEILANRRLLIGGQRLELLPPVPKRAALLRR